VESSARGPTSPKRIRLFGCGVISSEARDSEGPSEIQPVDKIPLVADAHPLQVDPGIGFLCLLEGFSFVSGWPLPDHPFVGSWPVLGTRARDGFDIAADQRDDFSVGHTVFKVPFDVF
jgi:hypothetical protein